jgi:nitrogen fixation protein FixH
MNTATTDIPRARRYRWPIIIISILAIQATGIIGMVVVSTRDPSFAIESNYYEKALAWDQTIRDREAAAALGWKAEISSEPSPSGRRLALSLRDRLDRPLEGAHVHISAYHHARARNRQDLELAPGPGGLYTGSFAADRAGHWSIDIDITRGPDRLTLSLPLEIEPPQ